MCVAQKQYRSYCTYSTLCILVLYIYGLIIVPILYCHHCLPETGSVYIPLTARMATRELISLLPSKVAHSFLLSTRPGMGPQLPVAVTGPRPANGGAFPSMAQACGPDPASIGTDPTMDLASVRREGGPLSLPPSPFARGRDRLRSPGQAGALAPCARCNARRLVRLFLLHVLTSSWGLPLPGNFALPPSD